MKVHFLGTGTSQGIPVIGSTHPVCLSTNPKDKRLRVSIWIRWESTSIVIDCGPDFRQQMLRSECPKIDALLFTHEHADHTSGLDDIRPFNFLHGDLPIYAHERVIANLKRRFDYIFATENRYPGAPSVITHQIQENQAFEIGGKSVVPISFWHADLQVFGFRIDNFAYLTDMKSIDSEAISQLKGVEVLVVNALRHEPHHSHFNLKEALDFIAIIQPKKAYLTHISHLLGFHDEIEKSLPNNVYLAYDNLELTI